MRKTQSQKEFRDQSGRVAATPYKILIDQGDTKGVDEVMKIMKDMTAQSALYYIPDQDSKSTFNVKYKLNNQKVNDKYLMSVIDGAK